MTTSRSSSPAPRLSAYLTGTLGTAALLGAAQADAAVTAVTFAFGSVLDVDSAATISIVQGPSGSYGGLYARGDTYRITMGVNTAYSAGSVYHTASWNSEYGRPTFFDGGDPVTLGGGANGALGGAFFRSEGNSSLNLTADEPNRNIGFRTSAGNYGWANVSWDNTASQLTIHSAYVESVAGDTITVGDTGAIPEPAASAALLALAGLGGASLTRRRRAPAA